MNMIISQICKPRHLVLIMLEHFHSNVVTKHIHKSMVIAMLVQNKTETPTISMTGVRLDLPRDYFNIA